MTTMKIQDDIDLQFDPNSYVEIQTTEATDKLPALFYRCFKNGVLQLNGWIERKQMEQLRDMINEQLSKWEKENPAHPHLSTPDPLGPMRVEWVPGDHAECDSKAQFEGEHDL